MDREEIAIRRAISADPWNDTPRLVFADWLEEHDQPERAEFIRVQCRLARMGEGDPERVALRKREQQLLLKSKAGWLREVPWQFRRSTFVRGFIQPVWGGPLDRFAEIVNLYGLVAPLWNVRLDFPPGSYPAQIDEPALLQADLLALNYFAESLTVPGPPFPELSSVNNVSDLQVRGVVLSPESLTQSLHSGVFSSLRRLSLAVVGLQPASLHELAQMDLWDCLEVFALREIRLPEDGLAELIPALNRSRLWSLGVHDCGFGEVLVHQLRDSKVLGGLQVLALAGCGVGDTGALALSLSSTLANLRSLNLERNRIGADGARALAESPFLAGLQRLSLLNNRLDARSTARKVLQERFGDRVVL